jgi:hypothetical protein
VTDRKLKDAAAQALGSFLSRETEGRFRSSHSDLTKLLPFAARLTLECIGNSDALYHDIEHTMLVTLVGRDILVGRTLQRTTTADDYANFILACLTHDIGYVRGIVQGDGDDAYVADLKGRKVQLPVGSSDAALAPYHIDRSKLFGLSGSTPWKSRRGSNCPAIEYADRTASAPQPKTPYRTHLSVIKQAPQSNGASNAV